MKPSRIIKSAHARAGRKVPLKAFARECLTGPDARLAAAAEVWLSDTKPGGNPRRTFLPLNGPGPTEGQIAARKRERDERNKESRFTLFVEVAEDNEPKTKRSRTRGVQ